MSGSVARSATFAAEAAQAAQAAQRLPVALDAQAESTWGVHRKRTLPPSHQRAQTQQLDSDMLSRRS